MTKDPDMKSESEQLWFLFGQKCVNVAGVAHANSKVGQKIPILLLHKLQPIKPAVTSSIAYFLLPLVTQELLIDGSDQGGR